MDNILRNIPTRNPRGGSAAWLSPEQGGTILINEFFDAPATSQNQFYIKIAGVWQACITWLNVAGTWVQATPKTKAINTWH